MTGGKTIFRRVVWGAEADLKALGAIFAGLANLGLGWELFLGFSIAMWVKIEKIQIKKPLRYLARIAITANGSIILVGVLDHEGTNSRSGFLNPWPVDTTLEPNGGESWLWRYDPDGQSPVLPRSGGESTAVGRGLGILL
jgi:hypothetical protein